MKGGRQGVRGVALISAMVVVAVVSASAAQLLYRQSIDVERSTRIMSREQAFLLAFGLETYARYVLAKDKSEYDYRYNHAEYEEGDAKIEEWSWPIPNPHMSDEWIEAFRRIKPTLEARIDDLSSLINVNGVHAAILQGAGGRRWKNMYENTFKKLLPQPLDNLETETPDDLWNILVDWFDLDDEVLDGGAEDAEYADFGAPYLTGRTRMAWPEELRLVKGFGGRVSDGLLPRVSALPSGRVRMNINTIKTDLLQHVLSSLPGFEDGEAAREIVGEISTRRSEDWYFTSSGQLKKFLDGYKNLYISESKVKKENRAEDFFDVKSSFFLFSACVRFGANERPIEIQSLLERRAKQKQVVVLQRRMGTGYYKGDRCGSASRRAGAAPPGNEVEKT